MLKKLLGEWLEERRLRGAPPISSDAWIYMCAFVDWVQARDAQQRNEAVTPKQTCRSCESGLCPDNNGGFIPCTICGRQV